MMKPTLRDLKFLLIFVTALSSFACASKEKTDINVQKIEADVVLRGWNQKGFGDRVATSIISIITVPGYKGDIVVLRKNKIESGFIAEVYKPKPDALNPELWEFVFGDIEKSIVKQPDGKFHLSEMVDEGVRIEILDLDSKK